MKKNDVSYENLRTSEYELHYGQPNDTSFEKAKIMASEIIKIIIVIATIVFLYRMQSPIEPPFSNEPIQYTTIDQQSISESGKRLFNRIPKYSEEGQYQSFKALQANGTKKDGDYAEKYLTEEIKKVLRGARYVDIHYFVSDPHNDEEPKVLNIAQPRKNQDIDQKRSLIRTKKTKEELEELIRYMENPFSRRIREFFGLAWGLSPQLTKMVNFAYTLSLHPKSIDYMEAEFYRLDKLYQLGKYGKQLPLCLVMVGKNNGDLLLRLYDSIERQNYTNYRIAHIDDNSNDNTQKTMQSIFNKSPNLKARTTLLTQPFQHNALYNRHYGNTKVCQDGDIIIDIDTDDYLIGSQTFQLVNALYQAGHQVKGKDEEIWALFLNFVIYFYGCCPGLQLHGQIDQKLIEKQQYRISDYFRTTHLRTYLRKLYQKVDPKDYVDEANPMKGAFYPEAPDLFMMDAIFELSAPKHIKFVDESVYFYTGSGSRDETYPEYCSVSGRSLPIYQPIESLDDTPVRGPSKMRPQYKQNMKKKVQERISKIRNQVLELYQIQKLKHKGK